MGSITRQVQRGSKSNEMLSQASKGFCQAEPAMESTFNSLQKSQVLLAQLSHQEEQIEKSLKKLEDVQEHIRDMQR